MSIPAVPKPDSPAFIDKVIVQLQDILKANLSWLDYSFGRSQKLTTTKDSRPYIYPGVHIDNGEYVNVFPDDTLKNFSFFIIEDPQNLIVDLSQSKATVKYALIIWVDLDVIFSGAKDRNSEAIKEQVLEVLATKTFLTIGRISVERVYEQAENIYKGYNIKEIESQFLMQPYYGFRFEGELTYEKLC